MKLNVTEYAARRKSRELPGSSRKSVYNALNKGWIRKGRDGLIDADKADAAWASKSQARSDGQSAGSSVVTAEDLNLHKARKEKALADIKELEAAQRRGELVELSVVASHWTDVGVAIKDRMMLIPERLAEQLAAATNQHDVRELLRREISSALRRLADDLEGRYT